ncbi:glycine-rich cell wall structural protein-like [Mizuhopecten yessoensis]|uniref:glycine-rich cell wall structural protein-like n=1 Tax=Mizuhopecten yessoensis TaxID=6573 RepID=UPI000B45EF60|nr:glycine-rich cell wall structural protein-like [Mizuhopecten yessoensis]
MTKRRMSNYTLKSGIVQFEDMDSSGVSSWSRRSRDIGSDGNSTMETYLDLNQSDVLGQNYQTHPGINNWILSKPPKEPPVDYDLKVRPAASNDTKKSAMELLSGFAERTSMVGVAYIHTSVLHMAKLIWTVLLLAAVGAMLFHLVFLCQQYYSWPKQTKITIQFSNLPPPAITICNANPIRKSQLSLASKSLKNLISSTHPNKYKKECVDIISGASDDVTASSVGGVGGGSGMGTVNGSSGSGGNGGTGGSVTNGSSIGGRGKGKGTGSVTGDGSGVVTTASSTGGSGGSAGDVAGVSTTGSDDGLGGTSTGNSIGGQRGNGGKGKGGDGSGGGNTGNITETSGGRGGTGGSTDDRADGSTTVVSTVVSGGSGGSGGGDGGTVGGTTVSSTGGRGGGRGGGGSTGGDAGSGTTGSSTGGNGGSGVSGGNLGGGTTGNSNGGKGGGGTGSDGTGTASRNGSRSGGNGGGGGGTDPGTGDTGDMTGSAKREPYR